MARSTSSPETNNTPLLRKSSTDQTNVLSQHTNGRKAPSSHSPKLSSLPDTTTRGNRRARHGDDGTQNSISIVHHAVEKRPESDAEIVAPRGRNRFYAELMGEDLQQPHRDKYISKYESDIVTHTAFQGTKSSLAGLQVKPVDSEHCQDIDDPRQKSPSHEKGDFYSNLMGGHVICNASNGDYRAQGWHGEANKPLKTSPKRIGNIANSSDSAEANKLITKSNVICSQSRPPSLAPHQDTHDAVDEKKQVKDSLMHSLCSSPSSTSSSSSPSSSPLRTRSADAGQQTLSGILKRTPLVSSGAEAHEDTFALRSWEEEAEDNCDNIYRARNLSVIEEETEEASKEESLDSEGQPWLHLLPKESHKTFTYTKSPGKRGNADLESQVDIELEGTPSDAGKVITLTLPEDHDPKDVPSGYKVVPLFHLRDKMTRKQTIQVAALMLVGFVFVIAILAWVFSPVILHL